MNLPLKVFRNLLSSYFSFPLSGQPSPMANLVGGAPPARYPSGRPGLRGPGPDADPGSGPDPAPCGVLRACQGQGLQGDGRGPRQRHPGGQAVH